MEFDSSLINKIVASRYAGVRAFAEKSSYDIMYMANAGASMGIASGYYQVVDGDRQIQFFPDNVFDSGMWWVDESQIILRTESTTVTSDKGQLTVNKLIENNYLTMNNLLVSANMVQAMASKGYNMNKEAAKLQALYWRIKGRDQKIKDCPFINSKQTSYEPTLTNNYGEDLKAIANANISGIGAVGTLTVIIVTVVVTAAVSWLVYRAFKKSYSDSTVDLRESDELKLALSKVDPETAQKIRSDLEAQIDAAYSQGVMDSNSDSFLHKLKVYGGTALGVFALFKFGDMAQIQKTVNAKRKK